jgi:hypothetical protein
MFLCRTAHGRQWYGTDTALIRNWHGTDTELTRHWYGTDTALTRHWYGTDTALIRNWHGTDTELTRHWYGTDTELTRHWYGTDTALIRNWHGTDTSLISVNGPQNVNIIAWSVLQTGGQRPLNLFFKYVLLQRKVAHLWAMCGRCPVDWDTVLFCVWYVRGFCIALNYKLIGELWIGKKTSCPHLWYYP